MATNGEMIDQIQEWINTDGELLSDEQVLENIRELVNGGRIMNRDYRCLDCGLTYYLSLARIKEDKPNAVSFVCEVCLDI